MNINNLIVGGGLIALGSVVPYMMRKFRTDEKLQNDIFHTYKYVAGGVSTTAGSAIVGSAIGYGSFLAKVSFPTSFIFGSLPCFVTLYNLRTTNRHDEKTKHINLSLFHIANGLIFSSLVAFLPADILIKAGVYAGSLIFGLSMGAIYSSFRSRNLGTVAGCGLMSLVVSGFLENIFSGSKMLSDYNIYVGLLVFAFIQLYDMKKFEEKSNSGLELDHINESVDFYLNFINMFIRLVRHLLEVEMERREEERKKRKN